MLDGKRIFPATGVFFVINKINPCCMDAQRTPEGLREKTTSDADIQQRLRLYIDCDPIRPADVSSTDEQKKAALIVAKQIARELRDNYGIRQPVLVIRGTGITCHYEVNLPNSQEITRLIERFLKAVAHLYNTPEVKVDTSVFNASRICKLPGTAVRKGDHTESQPHRMAQIIYLPSVSPFLTIELLKR